MPVLSAARQRGSNSRLGAVTKGMPLCAVVTPPPWPYQPNPTRSGRDDQAQTCNIPILPHGAWPADHSTQSHQPFSKRQLFNLTPIRHQGHVRETREPRRVADACA
eukprot:361794-Chlamydomonas_euryale.AAC.2